MTDDYLEVNRQVYDCRANHYKDSQNDKRKISSTEDAVLPFTQYLKSLKLSNKKRVLEIGPGAGIALRIFEREQFGLTAIDMSRKMIEASRNICPNCRYIEGNFLEYDFGDLSFEGIFANRVIHTFPRREALSFLEKAASLLASDGLMGIITSLAEKSYESFSADRNEEGNLLYSSRLRSFWEEKDLIKIIKLAGLNIFYKHYFNYYSEDDSVRGINLGVKNGK